MINDLPSIMLRTIDQEETVRRQTMIGSFLVIIGVPIRLEKTPEGGYGLRSLIISTVRLVPGARLPSLMRQA